MKKIFLLLLILATEASSEASIKITQLYEDIKFPPTEKVRMLVDKPEEPHLIFARIEKIGDSKTSTLEILADMEQEGRKIGADAFILERKVQRFPDGTFLIKSEAIKYSSNIKSLMDQGFVLRIYPRGWHLGAQMDILPLLFQGVHLSAWAGKENVRVQIGYYTMDIPEFYWQDGFQNGRILSGFEMTGAYFLNKGYSGLHGYLGFAQIRGRIGHEEESQTGTFKGWNILLGIGYQRDLKGSFYLNTKMSGQFLLSKRNQFQVGSRPAQLQTFSPSVSISIGYQIF